MNAYVLFYSCNKLFCFEILQSHREANKLGIKPSQVFEVSLWESRQRADDSLNLSCGAETALEKTSITVDCSGGISAVWLNQKSKGCVMRV